MAVDATELERALASGVPPPILVPGDVAGLTSAADTLRAHAAVLELAGAALARVEVTNWQGRAADGFTEDIGAEPPRWRTAADGFLAGALALEGFAASLGPARERAAQAADLYERYRAAADAAAALAAVPLSTPGTGAVAFGARIEQQQRAAEAGGPAAVMTADADALRRAAIDMLGSARSTMAAAGDIAAQSMTRAAEAAPDARRFWQATIRPADTVGTGHAALDAAGMIPGLGMIPDGVNATWYAATGDAPGAAISAIGMMPIVGDAVTAGKLVRGGAGEITKTSNEFWLFRGMRADGDGLPQLGRNPSKLGVRLGGDIPVSDAGEVLPREGGVSANLIVDDIPEFRRPPWFGGSDKTLSLFFLEPGSVDGRLEFVRDPAAHGTIQPGNAMSLLEYEDLLKEFRLRWRIVSP